MAEATVVRSDSWANRQLAEATVVRSDSWANRQLAEATVVRSDSWANRQLAEATVVRSDSWAKHHLKDDRFLKEGDTCQKCYKRNLREEKELEQKKRSINSVKLRIEVRGEINYF